MHTAENVLPNVHVRKQRIVLKQIPHLALLRAEVHALGRIEQRHAVQHDAATVRCLNTGNAFQGIAFSASRRTQYAEYAARSFQIRAEVEIPQIFFNVHGQAHLRTAFL